MKEGDIFENILIGMEYVVGSILNKIVVLQSTQGNSQIITSTEILQTKSFYRKKEKKSLPTTAVISKH